VAAIAPLEVLAHRGFWSFVVLGLSLVVMHRGQELHEVWRNPQLLLALGASTFLIAVNWLTFIYAVALA